MTTLRRLSSASALVATLVLAAPHVALAASPAPVVTDVSVIGSDVTVTFTNDVADVTSVDVVISDADANVVATDSIDPSSTSDTLVSVAPGGPYTAQIVDHTSSGDVTSDPSGSFAVPVVDPVPTLYTEAVVTIDPSTAKVELNADGTAWIVSFAPIDNGGLPASYVVETADGQNCVAYVANSSTDTASCEIGLLENPADTPVVSSINSLIEPRAYSDHPPISIDLSLATIVLNADETGWTVSWPEAAADGAQLSYIVSSNEGTFCEAQGTGVADTVLTCDLPLLDDPTQQPTLQSISTISVMYFARGGGTTNVSDAPTTTVPDSKYQTCAWQDRVAPCKKAVDDAAPVATRHYALKKGSAGGTLVVFVVPLALAALGSVVFGRRFFTGR